MTLYAKVRNQRWIEELAKEDSDHYENSRGRVISKRHVEKVSSNIEDLFDEKIIIKKNSKPKVMSPHSHIFFREDASIYGAIWDDFGLCYIAKLSKDGKWELI